MQSILPVICLIHSLEQLVLAGPSGGVVQVSPIGGDVTHRVSMRGRVFLAGSVSVEPRELRQSQA